MICSEFSCKYLGMLYQFLGIEATRQIDKSLRLTQSSYAIELLDKCFMLS